jgi:hypothetical protein
VLQQKLEQLAASQVEMKKETRFKGATAKRMKEA